MGAERPQKKFDWRDVDCFCQGKLSKAADTDAVIPEGTSIPREKKYRRYRKGIKSSTTVEHKKRTCELASAKTNAGTWEPF